MSTELHSMYQFSITCVSPFQPAIVLICSVATERIIYLKMSKMMTYPHVITAERNLRLSFVAFFYEVVIDRVGNSDSLPLTDIKMRNICRPMNILLVTCNSGVLVLFLTNYIETK